MNTTDLIGYLGSALIMIGFLPQAYQIIKTKSVADVSLATYSILLCGALVWITYGWLQKDWPIIVTNVTLFAVQGTIVLCKLKYGRAHQ